MNSLFIRIYGKLPRAITLPLVSLLKRTYLLGVVVVVFDENHRVLVLKHTYHKPEWRLPGGLMEKDEDPRHVAEREVREEALCDVKTLGVVDAAHTGFTFDIAVVARLVSESPFVENAEISARTWVPYSEISNLPPVQARFLKRAYDLLTFFEET